LNFTVHQSVVAFYFKCLIIVIALFNPRFTSDFFWKRIWRYHYRTLQ